MVSESTRYNTYWVHRAKYEMSTERARRKNHVSYASLTPLLRDELGSSSTHVSSRYEAFGQRTHRNRNRRSATMIPRQLCIRGASFSTTLDQIKGSRDTYLDPAFLLHFGAVILGLGTIDGKPLTGRCNVVGMANGRPLPVLHLCNRRRTRRQ